ncbi:MAG: hypothetical protein ABEJ28_01380, partial [Salinigranum sp.]
RTSSRSTASTDRENGAREVERFLESHELVGEVAVVGRPSDKWNQTVAAFVTVADEFQGDGLDYEEIARELNAYCERSGQLADFKRPRKYFFIDHLTKSNVGKILRRELQKDPLDITVHADVDVT